MQANGCGVCDILSGRNCLQRQSSCDPNEDSRRDDADIVESAFCSSLRTRDVEEQLEKRGYTFDRSERSGQVRGCYRRIEGDSERRISLG